MFWIDSTRLGSINAPLHFLPVTFHRSSARVAILQARKHSWATAQWASFSIAQHTPCLFSPLSPYRRCLCLPVADRVPSLPLPRLSPEIADARDAQQHIHAAPHHPCSIQSCFPPVCQQQRFATTISSLRQGGCGDATQRRRRGERTMMRSQCKLMIDR